MPPTKHALLGASKADRWLHCTPSARLEENFKESTSSYAEEGSLAHNIAELKLRYSTGEITKRKYNASTPKNLSKEMDEATQIYVDYVLERWEAAKTKCPDALLLVEEKLTLKYY